MVVGKVHTGDTHTDFQLLVKETDAAGTNSALDLGDASILQMIITDPSDTETTVTALILNSPGTDGIIRYINSTPSPAISTTGLWKYRAKIGITGGGAFQSNNATFEVLG